MQRIRGIADTAERHEHTVSSASSSKRFDGRSKPTNTAVNNAVDNGSTLCPHCAADHILNKCELFRRLSIDQRANFIKRNKFCFLCLRPGHVTVKCKSRQRCERCQRTHHTLFHREPTAIAGLPSTISRPSSGASTSSSAQIDSVPVMSTMTREIRAPTVLLATAQVNLRTAENRVVRVRALLDQGSTYSFMSESLCQTLRTRRYRANLQINCFGDQISGRSKAYVPVTLEPCQSQRPVFAVNVYVFPKLTAYTGAQGRPLASWPHLTGLPLADPAPSNNTPIHFLIGADLYGSLLLNGLRKGPPGSPTAQLIVFG